MTDRAELDRRLAEFLQATAPERTGEELLADVKRQEARMWADIRRNEATWQRDMQEMADGIQRWYVKPRRRRSARPSKAVVLRCFEMMGVNTDQARDRPGRQNT